MGCLGYKVFLLCLIAGPEKLWRVHLEKDVLVFHEVIFVFHLPNSSLFLSICCFIVFHVKAQEKCDIVCIIMSFLSLQFTSWCLSLGLGYSLLKVGGVTCVSGEVLVTHLCPTLGIHHTAVVELNCSDAHGKPAIPWTQSFLPHQVPPTVQCCGHHQLFQRFEK